MAFEFGADDLLCTEDDATPGNAFATAPDDGKSVASGGQLTRRESLQDFLEQQLVEDKDGGADAEGKNDEPVRVEAMQLTGTAKDLQEENLKLKEDVTRMKEEVTRMAEEVTRMKEEVRSRTESLTCASSTRFWHKPPHRQQC